MFVLDLEGNLLSVNYYFLQTTHYEEKDILSQKLSEIIFNLDKDIFENEFQKVINGKENHSFIARVVKKNSKLIYYEFIFNVDNESSLIYTTAKDVTGYIFNNNLLQEIALSIPGTIFKLRRTKNKSYVFDFINKNLEDVFKKVKGDSLIEFLDLLEEESQSEFLANLENSESKLSNKNFKIRFKDEQTLQVNLNPIRNKKEIIFYGIFSNIDNRFDFIKDDKPYHEIYKEETGYYIYKFDNFNVSDDYEKQKQSFLNGKVVECNDEFAKIILFDNAKQIIGKKVSEIIKNDVAINDFLNDLISHNYQVVNRVSFNKRLNQYMSSKIETKIVGNKIIELKGIFENITSIVSKQKQLEVAIQNYKNSFDYAPIGIMIHNDSAIVASNKVLLEYLETTEKEFIGQFPTHFVTQKSLPKVQTIIENYKNNNFTSDSIIISVKTAKGNIKEFQATPCPIEYNDEKCIEVTFVDLTEINEIHNENLKNKEQLASILDNTKNYIIRVDSKGKFIYCNKAYKERIGFDVTGTYFNERINDKEVNKLVDFVAKLHSRTSLSKELVVNTTYSKGNHIKIQWNMTIFFENDELVIQGIGEDITEIEEVKSNLELSNQKYKMAAQIAKIAYWEFYPNTKRVIWSNELYDLLGINNDVVANSESFMALSHQDDIDLFKNQIKHLNDENDEICYNHRMKSNDGNYKIMETTVKVRFNDGIISNYFGIIRDITEDVEKNELIKRNELFYRKTIDSVSEGIILQDKDDKVVLHNSAAETILGLTSGQLLGIDSYDLSWRAVDINGEELDSSGYPSVVTRKTGQPVRNFIMGVKRNEKQMVWVLINSEPVSFNNDNVIDATVTSFTDITMMLTYQKQLVAKENQLRVIFNYSPNGKIICDSNNKIILVNKFILNLLEIPENQLLGVNYEDIFTDNKNENELLLQLLNKKIKFYKIIREYVNKFNELKSLECRTTLIFDNDNQVINIIHIISDFTEIINTTNILKSRNLLLNTMGYLSSTGAWEYNLADEKFTWTDSVLDIYGVTDENEINTEFEEKFYHPNDYAKVKKIFANIKNSPNDFDISYRLIDAKGETKSIRSIGKVVFDKNNLPIKVIGVIQDISDMIKRENEIRSKNISLTQLKYAIDSSAIVSYSNIDGTIIEVNKKFEEIYGFKKEEVIGQKHQLVSSGYHSKEFWEEFWHFISNGIIWTGEILNRKKNGDLIWFSALIFPLKDEKGKIMQYLEILTDISLNKNYQENLEKTVEERTCALTEANNEKDFILQMVSHDLKNPLTGILLQSEIIKRYAMKNEDTFVIEKTEYLIENTKRMNLIINNLLEFEAIKSNQDKLIQDVNLKTLIANIYSSYKNRLLVKNQNLIIQVPNYDIIVKSNKEYLFQIIENLVSNASKFSQKEKNIYIMLEKSEDAWVIKIKDEGPGIEDEDKNKVFKKFTKLSNKPTNGEDSSGLGLSIVKKICDLLGHQISFQTQVNIGTIFSISIKV